MILHPPFQISSRLLPALHVDDGWLSLEHVGQDEGRCVYRWYIDIPDGEFSEADIRSGVNDRVDYQRTFGSLLAFLGAAAESYSSWLQFGKRPGENIDLFPAPVVLWAHMHSDELSTLQSEITESGAVLIEE